MCKCLKECQHFLALDVFGGERTIDGYSGSAESWIRKLIAKILELRRNSKG